MIWVKYINSVMLEHECVVNQYASEKHTHRTYAVWFQWNNITLSSKSYFFWFAFRVHGTTPESPRNLLVLDLPKACVDGLQRDAAEHALTPADFRWTVSFAEVETSEGKETKEITETWQFEKEVKWTSKYIEIHGGLPFLEHLEDVVAAFLMFWRMKKIPGSFTRFSWRASFEKLLMDFWYLRVANLETCLLQHLHAECQHTRCCRSPVMMQECWTDMWPSIHLYSYTRAEYKDPTENLTVRKIVI